MTGTTWMMLLSILLISVGLSYSGMKKMNAPLPKYTKSEVAAAPSRTVDAPSVIAAEPRKKEEVRNWDLLWKNTLFTVLKNPAVSPQNTEILCGKLQNPSCFQQS